MAKRSVTGQAELLEWTPPEPTARFDEAHVRANSFNARLSRAVAAVIRDSGMTADEIADRMTGFLGGRRVSVNMLLAYSSQAREEHTISVERLVALMHATKDRRVLQMIAEQFGWTVIEARYLPLIELAAVQDRQDELRRKAEALRRTARSGGAL